MCPGFPNREAEVHRLSLALAVTAITLCCGTVTRAQVSTAFYPVGPTVCQPLPSWYPRGWELMVRYPCATLCLWTFILSKQLTLIRRSTRTSECQLVLYTGSIAGHICVLAGGGEDAVGPSSPALSEGLRCRVNESPHGP